MSYIRFVIHKLDEQSERRQGLFQAMGDLLDDGRLNEYERIRYKELYQWFNDNLEKPLGLARSKKVHAKNVALSWFKDSAQEHISRMRELIVILEANGIEVVTLTSEKPGYVVYEDDYQVAAEPFKETQT